MDDSHFNKNLPCAVAIKTTSDSASEGELIQIALVPLNKFFEPSVERLPLWIHICPEDGTITKSVHDEYRAPRYDYPQYMLATPQEIKVSKETGVTYEQSLTLIEGWFDKLRLGQHKKLLPLAYGYGYLMPFLHSWLGYRTYEDIFDWHYRDPFAYISFDMDRKYQRNEEHKWRKIDLTSVLSSAGVESSRERDVMSLAVDQAKLYQKLLQII